MKSRNELLREFYCGEADSELQPRPQTGPKASFMSWVGQVKDREAFDDVPKGRKEKEND